MYFGRYIFTSTGTNKMYFHLYNSIYTLNILNMNNDVKCIRNKNNYSNLKIMYSDLIT